MPNDTSCTTDDMAEPLKEHRVWSPGLRWFHWINALCVFALIGSGIIMLRETEFGLSADGRYFVESLHVHIAYLFALNLLWRVYLGFFGDTHARWSALLPRGPQYWKRLYHYVRGWLRGRPPVYLGHNPLVRLIGTLTLGALLLQAGVGLSLARGDLYLPPYAGYSAAVAKTGAEAPTPQASRAYPTSLVHAHVALFALIAILITLHIGGVILMDIAERSGLISGTFTGRKYLRGPPAETLPVENSAEKDRG
jgi:Ni/Fe-hydrogenase 1 B-type cytochrome subunit